MSTTVLGKILHKVGNYDSSLFGVNNSYKNETLADYVRRKRTEAGLSTTDVQDRSRKGNRKGISDSYVTRIENGYVTNVSPNKLKALAFGLGVDEDEIFAIARGKSGNVPQEEFENSQMNAILNTGKRLTGKWKSEWDALLRNTLRSTQQLELEQRRQKADKGE